MDNVPILDQIPAMVSKTAWRVPVGMMGKLALAAFTTFSSQVYAQSQTVEVAVEPNLLRSLSSLQKAQQQEIVADESGENLESVEPERMHPLKKEDHNRKSEAKKPATNFLPAQRPIGQVNIDLRSKPKNGSNAIPENLAEKAMGEIPVVQASRSDEMHGDLIFSRSLNHDERFAHQPLYFEEVNLERYGRTCGPLQPAISSLRFFATIPSLPYAMTVHQPNRTYTTKWPFEAGWGAPRVAELQPLQLKPSLVQAGVITGLLFVVP